jgi:hypothetical protein
MERPMSPTMHGLSWASVALALLTLWLARRGPRGWPEWVAVGVAVVVLALALWTFAAP